METVAICGFYQDIIGLWKDSRRAEDHIFVPAYIPAKGEMGLFSILFYFERNGRATDDMTRIGKENLNIFINGMPGVIFYAYKMIQRLFGIVFGIERSEIRLT